MLFVVREVKARLERVKGKKWGNPADGDRILEARKSLKLKPPHAIFVKDGYSK
jgi:hypothetical protein